MIAPRFLSLAALLVSTLAFAQQNPPAASTYEIVIRDGRVLDPETGLDAVRNVGISAGRIARVSAEPLQGARVIDAEGLVVAPGFIDLHQHGQTIQDQRLKAMDGVTTALELEIGAPDVAGFLREHQGHSLINFGTSASHAAARVAALGVPIPPGDLLPHAGPATNNAATREQIAAIRARLDHELAAGAIGVGVGLQYVPGASRLEVIETFREAARWHVPIYTHIRSNGRTDPGSSFESVNEVIGAAAISGAPLHIVHINSMCGAEVPTCLGMIAGARGQGLDVTTEAYPYIAGMTSISSALFDPGWRERMGIDYHDLMMPDTGERLTKERFDALHAAPEQRTVILFTNTEPAVDAAITNPLVMIASDGLAGHPRNAGTYARVLSRYVRQQRSLTLMEAVRKMTLMPAQRLENATASARRKGRIQEGADADIVVFAPDRIEDRATYQKPNEPSVGVEYLLVGGTVVVDHHALAPNEFPGRALTNDRKSAE